MDATNQMNNTKNCPKCNNLMDTMNYPGSYICPKCKYQVHKIIIQKKILED